MKKMILIFMVLLVLPIVLGGDISDSNFYRPYLQSYNFFDVTDDTYLLRATSYDTNIDYTNWESCSVTLGGSEERGQTFTYVDSITDYVHTSLIVVYANNIKQYGADCSVLDTYFPNGIILSKVGIINGGRESNDYFSPMFGFVIYDPIEMNNYFIVLTLDDETSKFEFYGKWEMIASTTLTKSDIYGVAGGCYHSYLLSNCDYFDRTFAVYDNSIESIFIVSGGDLSDPSSALPLVPIDTGKTYINQTATNNMLWFGDWDNDAWNEYLIIGLGVVTSTDLWIVMQSYQPLFDPPYYFNINYSKEIESTDSIHQSQNDLSDLSYAGINLCQIGDINSELEICYSTAFESTTGDDYRYIGFVNNNFTDGIFQDTRTLGEEYWNLAPFTYDIPDTDGDLEVCLAGVFTYGGDEEIMCFDEDINQIGGFNISHSYQNTPYPIELIVTEIDNNSETIDFLFADGTSELVNISDWTSISGTDWFPAFTTAEYGQMYVQDINNDKYSEFIYIDDTYLKIYSMDSTPFVFRNFTKDNIDFEDIDDDPTDVPSQSPDEIVRTINNNIMFIVALFLILALMIGVVQMGVRSPLVIAFAGIIGAIISVALGLVSGSVLVIIIICLVVLMLLVMYLKSGGDD